jgi:hypothetical protein
MKIIAVIPLSEHSKKCQDTLESGMTPPTDIFVSKASSGLGALCEAMDVGSDSDYFLYLNGNCTYPPHLIKEYETSIPSLKAKIPDSDNGSIYGLAGIVVVKDKDRNLDLEFQKLTGHSVEPYEERNLIGYIQENGMVDYLESCGSILIHRSQLKDDFKEYLDTAPAGSDDVILSNYFAKHKILRTQICSLVINRFMLLRAGYFSNYKELPELEKRSVYEDTVHRLREKEMFYAYA